MNKNRKFINFYILIFAFAAQLSYSQDSTKNVLKTDTIPSAPELFLSVSMSMNADYLIIHSPAKEDSLFYKKHSKLINAEPTKNNYSDYYALACSLWELSRTAEAEKMFLKIMDSKASYYVGTYYGYSDIPGDTTTNTYGYGSYTSNYKNGASRYLAKIYIEEKKFTDALKYTIDADKKYTVVQNCGTGYMWYRSEIDGLYGFCYEGLEKYDSVINLFLPNCFDWHNGALVRALKKTYSKKAIDDYLKTAENSVVCVLDTFQSTTSITHNYGETNELTTEIKYTSGTATTMLFGKQIILPRPNLENREKASRELFVKNFKESSFYMALKENE